MKNALIAIALFVVLCVGWQELEGIGRGLLVLGVTGAAGLLLPGNWNRATTRATAGMTATAAATTELREPPNARLPLIVRAQMRDTR